MISHNKGYCYWCGDPVDDSDYTYLGHQKVWCCYRGQCAVQADRDEREAYLEAREEYMRASEERFNQGWY